MAATHPLQPGICTETSETPAPQHAPDSNKGTDSISVHKNDRRIMIHI